MFEVRTLTPLFLAGAELAGAELRAPTLRGLLRYWLRALVGGLLGTDGPGLASTRQMESAIFGSAGTRSAITVQVSGASQGPREFSEKISMRQGEKQLNAGRGYLLWSMTKRGRRGNFRPARWYYPAGTGFQVVLSARELFSQQLKQATAAFWLLTHLGGIGSRARRCAGSIQASIQDSRLLTTLPSLSFVQAEHSQALKKQLESGIDSARKLIALEKRPVQDARFDVLASGACRIWILHDGQPWHSAERVLQVTGERLQAYRSRLSIEQRKIFGLPLANSTPGERRASPLHLRVTRLRGSQYVCVAVLFKTVSEDVRVQDHEVIEHWSDEFRGKIEVQL
ncbi:MAG: type III-B CRISPR module RAMP protein Cmr1 [Chloroflexota bacterium]|nr:type III-B CRISPR module RAMP protein Cmr1 [Chloroflexota bacterium]